LEWRKTHSTQIYSRASAIKRTQRAAPHYVNVQIIWKFYVWVIQEAVCVCVSLRGMGVMGNKLALSDKEGVRWNTTRALCHAVGSQQRERARARQRESD